MLAPLVAALVIGQAAPITDFPKAEEPPIEVKVLVLNFNPMVPSNEKSLRDVCAFNDAKTLSDQYIADVDLTSGGFVKLRVVEWREIDAFPPLVGRVPWTAESYMAAHGKGDDPEQSITVSTDKILKESDAAKLIDEGVVDEVWLFGAPRFGFEEGADGVPAFSIQGPGFSDFAAKRPFAVMRFNYGGGVGEMLHTLCHRAENLISRVYGGWNPAVHDTPWAKFAAAVTQTKGFGGVGNCHWPPNAEKELDYDNRRIVWTNADLYLKYPNLRGRAKPVNRDNWGGPDYERNYLKWWFARLPKAPKEGRDGRQHNWWKYVFEFAKYDVVGKPVR